MFTSTSNLNPKTSTLNAIKIRENLSYFAKFRLSPSVALHIYTRLIFHDVHLHDFITPSDMELNSRVLMWLEFYQWSKTFVIHRMQKVFRDEFHGWRYTEFSRLNRRIRGAPKELFMHKHIFMSTAPSHVNQRLALSQLIYQ